MTKDANNIFMLLCVIAIAIMHFKRMGTTSCKLVIYDGVVAPLLTFEV